MRRLVLHEEFLDTNYLFIITNKEQLADSAFKEEGADADNLDEKEDSGDRAYQTNWVKDMGNGVKQFWVGIFLREDYTLWDVVHELTHSMVDVFDYKQVLFSKENDEVMARYMDTMIKKFIEADK